MGCCFSRTKTQNQNQNQNQNPQNHSNSLKNNQPHLRSSLPKSNPIHHEQTPPPPPEEESVKEVLSETPISKPQKVSILMQETNTQIPKIQNPSQKVPILIPETNTQIPEIQNPSLKFENKTPIEESLEVVSQISEQCTITESLSISTTTTTVREDEATSKQCNRESTTTTTMNHKWNRSPSRKRPHVADGNVAGGNERRVKSPARRPEPSPEKKIKNGSRLVRGRESGSVANRKGNVGSAGFRRDTGEGSGRRSRSPSCTRTVSGSSKVVTGGSRKQAPVVEKEKEKKKNESEEVGEKNDIVSHGESIENPHVSMECFIFL